MLGSSSAVEVQVPHKRILSISFCMHFYGRGGERGEGEGGGGNQYLLGTSELDSNASTAPIPKGYKIHEVILELISSDIKLLYDEQNGLE